jgi:iron complex transport system permease protein
LKPGRFVCKNPGFKQGKVYLVEWRPMTLTPVTNRSAAWPRLGMRWSVLLLLLLGLLLAFALSLAIGSVQIPLDNVLRILLGGTPDRATWDDIIFKFRLPKAITAMLAGAALSVSGLQMQTLFRNPLADPFVLGISSGASLGVALVILGSGLTGVFILAGMSLFGDFSLALAASLGASAVLGVVLLMARRIQHTLTLLVLGLMFGYLTSAIVSLLIYTSLPERVQAFNLWSAGSFAGVTWGQLRVLAPLLTLGLALAQTLSKSLNALLLGEGYARTLGMDVSWVRRRIILSAALLAGVTTAFCGPVGFIGIAVPHIGRMLFRSADHRLLLPACVLLGAIVALLADMIAQSPGGQLVLPLNVVTSLFGVPIVIWLLLRQRQFEGRLTD